MKMRTDYKIGLIVSSGSWLVYTYYLLFKFSEVRSCTVSHFLILTLVGIGLCGGSLRSEVNELKEENKRLKNNLEISSYE
jgi:hypothetical protein